MRTLKLAIAGACAAACAYAYAGAASAEAFTFVNTNTGTADQVVLRSPNPDGRPTGATVYAAHTAATFTDGRKAETNARCSAWILPPDNQFGQNGVCEYKDASGPLYETRFTCAAPTKGGNGVDCWGTLTGTGGAWKGRTGAFTLHSAPNNVRGEGHWND
jgi:hypothetical protein